MNQKRFGQGFMTVISTSQQQAALGRVTERPSPQVKQVVDSSAITAPTLFVESQGRRLAYQSVGEGPPLILCVRFRGMLDVWDPAFIDALARAFARSFSITAGLANRPAWPAIIL